MQCNQCTQVFSRKQNLLRHEQEYHQGISVKKYSCSTNNHHHKDCSSNLPRISINGITRIITTNAFKDQIRIIRFYSDSSSMIPTDFFQSSKQLIQDTLQILKKEIQPIKISSRLCVTFSKLSNTEINDEAYFSVASISIEQYDLNYVIDLIITKIISYSKRGSDWNVKDTKFFELNSVITN